MNFIAFCTSYWHDANHALSKAESLRDWHARMLHYFEPSYFFISCGTYSDPEFNPLEDDAVIVNSGMKLTKPYDVHYQHYSMCAFSAACWHAVSLPFQWDLMLTLDTDTIVGNVDFDSLLREFMDRPEILLSTRWMGLVDFGFSAWKREAAVRYLHYRRRPNIVEDKPGPLPLLQEEENQLIYAGLDWNPWPDVRSIRQDYGYRLDPPPDAEAANWPFIRFPTITARERFAAKTKLAKPFNHSKQ